MNSLGKTKSNLNTKNRKISQSSSLEAAARSRTLETGMPASNTVEAQLVFDSAGQRSDTTVRSGGACARQLLYKAGDVCVDMYVQAKPGSASVALTGQLLDSKHPTHAMRDVPVSLLRQGDEVSHKKTNQVGEFDFGVDLPKALQLVFGIGKRGRLVVNVPDLDAGSALQFA